MSDLDLSAAFRKNGKQADRIDELERVVRIAGRHLAMVAEFGKPTDAIKEAIALCKATVSDTKAVTK